MSTPYSPRIGGVLSADIAVPEHEREVGFYVRVLTTGEHPLWREDLMNNLGVPIIGLGAQTPEYADLPLQWMPHIQVADVAASVDAALALGGGEILHAKDDDGHSQWAAIHDPNGAAFGIMPVVPEDMLPRFEDAAQRDAMASAGRIAGLDLTVPDAATTRAFYQQVVGWSAQDSAVEDAGDRSTDYTLFCDDGHATAGIHHARGSNQDLPPVWLLALPVGDLAESLRRVQEGDGTVIKATQGADGEYTHAVIQDPVGVYVALVPGS